MSEGAWASGDGCAAPRAGARRTPPGVHRVCAQRASPPCPGGQEPTVAAARQPCACTIALPGGRGLRVRPGEGCRRLLGSPRSPQPSGEPVLASRDGTLFGGRLAFWASQGGGAGDLSERHPERAFHLRVFTWARRARWVCGFLPGGFIFWLLGRFNGLP